MSNNFFFLNHVCMRVGGVVGSMCIVLQVPSEDRGVRCLGAELTSGCQRLPVDAED